jgi:hypothetical protein
MTQQIAEYSISLSADECEYHRLTGTSLSLVVCFADFEERFLLYEGTFIRNDESRLGE